ncbi:MAG: hypothetical protein JRN52_14515 [Nitrososphaerota archaeon]|nr:hypothetical protein [Nitrososphaerota archaeon]
MTFERERTPIEIVFCSMYLVFLALSFRRAKSIKQFINGAEYLNPKKMGPMGECGAAFRRPLRIGY